MSTLFCWGRGGGAGHLAIVGTIPLWFEANSGRKRCVRARADVGTTEAARKMDLLVVALHGGSPGYSLVLVLFMAWTLFLILVFGSAMWWRRLRPPG